MINFCHISPTAHLKAFCEQQTHHLLLAHLVEQDDNYVQWYKYRKTQYNDSYKVVYILDNSAFEKFKAGEPMYPSEKLIKMGQKIKANYIVMSDYPGEAGSKTIAAAKELAPQFRKNGFGTFFVPQSVVGDKEDYIDTFTWAAQSPHVDYIGVSILGVPNAYGVEKNNNLQRFLSRWRMMGELRDLGVLAMAKHNNKKIHFLGMVDGPNEIELCREFDIDTWDSSAAVWAGFNGIHFDESPSGLINGKYEEEVDFSYESKHDDEIDLAFKNQKYINSLCKKRI